jgi:hypothetical protein
MDQIISFATNFRGVMRAVKLLNLTEPLMEEFLKIVLSDNYKSEFVKRRETPTSVLIEHSNCSVAISHADKDEYVMSVMGSADNEGLLAEFKNSEFYIRLDVKLSSLGMEGLE